MQLALSPVVAANDQQHRRRVEPAVANDVVELKAQLRVVDDDHIALLQVGLARRGERDAQQQIDEAGIDRSLGEAADRSATGDPRQGVDPLIDRDGWKILAEAERQFRIQLGQGGRGVFAVIHLTSL